MLYTRHAPVLKSVCLRYIKDRDEAKDVLQDGFIKIFNSIGKFTGEGSLEGWLKRIVINVALDHIKRSQRLPFTQTEDWELDEKQETEHPMSSSDLLLNAGFSSDDLLQLLHSIPTAYSCVFSMFHIDRLSHWEIGEILKIGESTSRKRLFRARELLRSALEKEIAKRQLK